MGEQISFRRRRRFAAWFAHATEPEVIRPRIEFPFSAAPGYVPRTVLVGAKERTAALHALAHARLVGIQAIRRSLRVNHNLSAGCQGGVVIGAIPIRSPLPDVACHVEQTVSICRKRTYGRGCNVAVFASVFVGEVTLEGVRHVPSAGHKCIAPGVALAIESAARSKLELRFR